MKLWVCLTKLEDNNFKSISFAQNIFYTKLLYILQSMYHCLTIHRPSKLGIVSVLLTCPQRSAPPGIDLGTYLSAMHINQMQGLQENSPPIRPYIIVMESIIMFSVEAHCLIYAYLLQIFVVQPLLAKQGLSPATWRLEVHSQMVVCIIFKSLMIRVRNISKYFFTNLKVWFFRPIVRSIETHSHTRLHTWTKLRWAKDIWIL